MKIVIDARESGTSTGRYIDQLVTNLHALKPKHKFVIVTKPARVEFYRANMPGFEVVETNYKEFSFGEQLGFARQLKRLKADLVHFNAPQQPLLYTRPSVTTVHDLTTARFTNPGKFWPVFKLKQLIYRWVVKLVAARAKKIIAISQFTKDDLVDFTHIAPANVKVIYEAADKISAAPRPVATLKNKQFIMYAGRPQPHKNLRRLIKAFANLQVNHPDLKLALIGQTDDLYAKHFRYVQKRGIQNVIFTGFVPDAQLRWLYENTAAYVVPSLSEGFGLPGLEAMAHGAPVASSDATCLPEIYGRGAVYFNPKNVDQMAGQIDRLLVDKSLAAKQIRAGKARAARYSWVKTAVQTLAVYNQVSRS